MMMAMVAMQSNQNREITALTERMAAIDLVRQLSFTEADPATCSLLVNQSNLGTGASLTFDSTAVSGTKPQIIHLKSVPGIGTGAPNIVTENGLPSSISNSLFVPTGGVSLQVTGPYTGNLSVAFAQDQLVRPIHNISLPLILSTTGGPNSKLITGCQGVSGTNSQIITFRAGDIEGMAPSSTLNQGIQRAIAYSFTLPVQTYDQNLLVHVIGMWNILACAGGCAVAINVMASVGGKPVSCGQAGYYGASGPYNSVHMGDVSCVIHVPANSQFALTPIWDGRAGAVANFDWQNYRYESVGENVPIVTIYPMK